MTKRQMRIYTNEIPSVIDKFLNLPVSVIMKTGAVFLFRILKMNDDYLKVEDLRKKIQKIKITDIEEIIIEAENPHYAQKSIN